MGCLDNLVGLRGCSEEEPITGIYIDDQLPINRDHFQEVADGYQLRGETLFNDLYSAAVKAVANDIKKALPNYHFKGVIESRQIGELREIAEYLPVNDEVRGVELRFKTGCELAVWKIKEISFCRKDNTSANVLIYQRNDSEDVYTLTNTINLGTETTYNTPIILNGDYVRVVVDNSSHEVCDIPNVDPLGMCCHMSCCDYFYAYGWDGTAISNSTYGLRLKVDVLCDVQELMCRVSDGAAFLLMYKIYIMWLRKAQLSQKASIFMSGAEGQIEKEIMRYEDGFVVGAQFHKGKYYTELDQVCMEIEGIIKEADCSACFDCKTPYNAKSYN